MLTRDDLRQFLIEKFREAAPDILAFHGGISPRDAQKRLLQSFLEEIGRRTGINQALASQIVEILESGELDQEIAAILGYC